MVGFKPGRLGAAFAVDGDLAAVPGFVRGLPPGTLQRPGLHPCPVSAWSRSIAAGGTRSRTRSRPGHRRRCRVAGSAVPALGVALDLGGEALDLGGEDGVAPWVRRGYGKVPRVTSTDPL